MGIRTSWAMLDLFDYQNPPTSITVKVIPKAKQACIKKENTPQGAPSYRVYVTAPAQDGKANRAVVELIAEALNVPKSNVAITHGFTSREKRIAIRYT